MTNAATIFGRPARRKATGQDIKWVLPDQLIGVEIEVEAAGSVYPSVANLSPYWSHKRDGSLRNGMEYVLACPLKGDALSAAVSVIFHDSVFARSMTGSTHIHLDMMEEETDGNTIKVMVLLLYALEAAVFAAADRGREFCGYTNKLCTAPDTLLAAVLGANEEEDYETLRRMCRDEEGIGRYYGLNLMSLHKFGSLEFRYFPTCTSQEELISWIQLVMSFKKAALEVGTTDKLYEIFNNEDLYDQFLLKYFEPWLEVFRAEVPQYTSIVMFKKAMTVAGSKLLRGSNTKQEFDVRAVVRSKSLAKFAAKLPPKPSEVTPLPIINHVAGAIPTNQQEGQIMMYSGAFYVWQRGDWKTIYDMQSRETTSGLVALASVNAVPSFSAKLNEWGIIDTSQRRRLTEGWEIMHNELSAIYAHNNGFRSSNRDVVYTGLEVLEEGPVVTQSEPQVVEVPPPVVVPTRVPHSSIWDEPIRTRAVRDNPYSYALNDVVPVDADEALQRHAQRIIDRLNARNI